MQKPGDTARYPVLREWRVVSADLPPEVAKVWVLSAAAQSQIASIAHVLQDGVVRDAWGDDVAVAVEVTESKILAVYPKGSYFYLLERLRTH